MADDQTPSVDQRPAAAGPVRAANRVVPIDALRGFAVLGILLINILGFGLPLEAMGNPTVAGGATGPNLWVWVVGELLVEGSMRGIFSMLFGAGMVLLTSRLERRGHPEVADIYYRRTLWLVMFGMIHAYLLLMPGDVLFAYGIAGLFLFPFRKLNARTCLLLAPLLLAVTLISSFVEYFDTRQMQEEYRVARRVLEENRPLTPELQAAHEAWLERLNADSPQAIAEEIEARRSGYPVIFREFVPVNIYLQSLDLYSWTFWEVTGMMFLGMGLLKIGVLSGERSRRFYVMLLVVGYGVGLAVNLFEVRDLLAWDFDPVNMRLRDCSYQLGRIPVMFGHLALVQLICSAGSLQRAVRALTAAGRMALTNYISQTVICVLLFYGVGFGWFGRFQRHQLYYFVAAIWVVQLAFSVWWMGRYRYGPLEWCWRRLTYGADSRR